MKKAEIQECIEKGVFVYKASRYGWGQLLLPIEFTTKKTYRHGAGVMAVKCQLWSDWQGVAKPQKYRDTEDICTADFTLAQISGQRLAWTGEENICLTTENVVEMIAREHDIMVAQKIAREEVANRTETRGRETLARFQTLTGFGASFGKTGTYGYTADYSKIVVSVDDMVTLIEMLERATVSGLTTGGE